MWGGPSHLDTFDPKPAAGYDYCGPLSKPIRTNVDGIIIGELLPLLAKQADKYAIIRSMTHGNNGHETAAYMVQTGRPPGRAGRFSLRRGRGVAVPRLRRRLSRLDSALYRAHPNRRGDFPRPDSCPHATNPSPPAAIRPRAGSLVEGIVAPGVTDQQQRDRRESAPQAEHVPARPERRRLAEGPGRIRDSKPTS